MAKRSGGQPGNQNAIKGQPYADALRRALAQWKDDQGKGREALFAIGEKAIEDAISGTPEVRARAREHIADRLDGKPAQQLDINGDAFAPVLAPVFNVGFDTAPGSAKKDASEG